MRAIIFDMDGVLVDSMPYHADAWIFAFETVDINIDRKAIYELEGSNHRQIVEIILRRFGRTPAEDVIQELVRKKIEVFDRIEHVRPFDGIKELLATLRSKYKLAVVSGTNRKTVHEIIDNFFPDTFEVIINGDDTPEGKPSPVPYLKAVEKLGIPKEHCLVIENAPLGIRSAKNAGLRCIAISTYLGREWLKEADAIVDSHRELERYIAEEERIN
ncbi:haloacid dehalogenase superfamily protein, subfamily IA, variant 3 with third motif having DD or ED [Candidatus Methanoperedens nitroreducens]|uniref:Haloacid dehalogenase superfamily protein, subfamily IA, variant 3 with third motif having DD or ED n=1 Tax=Candidatus Methanoperedens nitratireducens TaxID=1392998 RepID=A0A062VBB8_9EURY|nr:HAD family phosphatase [Candidatus Methanoperedens nitroreducens]KCZ72610.1 haloacid dehalogenase superfamily protein, subfamily IA, variant 3 with third motif having DD or ED [Candidatus Methanoperedens nitroreducens]MDJ1423458.1 HAD family phosphatase [Candidatus Methanoperedens sp.]